MITVTDVEGASVGVTYYQDANSAIATLTGLLGFAPTRIDKPSEAPMNSPEGGWDFGGLVLMKNNGQTTTPNTIGVIALAPSAHGIPIQGIFGVTVGMSTTDLPSQFDNSGVVRPEGTSWYWAADMSGYRQFLIFAAPGSSTVTALYAPLGA